MVEKDWLHYKIKNIARVIRGASPRPKGDKRYYGGDVPRLMVKDVTRDGKFVTPQVDFLTKEGEKLSRPCKKGTLTIVCSGTVGIPSFLAVDACIHDGFLALIEIDKNISNDYLYHQLSSLRNKFESSATHGGVFTNLTTSILEEFTVAFPPTKEEQSVIAESLSNTDNLIQQLDYLVTKKKNIKQGAMQELLTGKRRLSGFSGKWEIKKLGDCLIKKPEYGINASAVKYSDNLHVYIRITDISEDGTFIHENKTSVNHPTSDQFILETGDIVFARTGASTGKTYLYDPEDGKLVFAGFLIRVKTDPKKLVPEYLKIFTETRTYWNWVKKTSMRSGQAGINGTEYSELIILTPPIKEQIAIGEIILDIDSEIKKLEKNRDKYIMLKNGMMQKLLTGEIRLQ